MTRYLKYGLTLALLVGIAQGQAGQEGVPTRLPHVRAAATTRANRGPCDEERYDVRPAMETATIHRKVTALIGCVTARWDVPGGKAKAVSVALCESSLYPWASSNGNEGLFQLRFWTSRARVYLRRAWFWKLRDRNPYTLPSAYQARANTLVAIAMAHRGWSWAQWSCG